MKNYKHAAVLACAVICFSLGLNASPAHAMQGNETVRAAQMRLTDLGYYAGPYDGLTGRRTKAAVLDFQRANNLPVTGRLTPATENLLWRLDYAARHGGSYGYHPVYADPMTAARYASHYMPASGNSYGGTVDWSGRWVYSHTQNIHNRYARLELTEEDEGSLRHYAIMLNGRPVLFANDQPDILRVSHVFAMNNEDAVIFTAYRGDGKCAYKNYLLAMHADGTTAGPQEIGDCAGSLEAHVANNALIISFPVRPGAWGFMDMWRYQNGSLARL